MLPVGYHNFNTACIVLVVNTVCHMVTWTALGACGIALLVLACRRKRDRTSRRELRQQLLQQSCSYEEVDPGVREDQVQIIAGTCMQPMFTLLFQFACLIESLRCIILGQRTALL